MVEGTIKRFLPIKKFSIYFKNRMLNYIASKIKEKLMVKIDLSKVSEVKRFVTVSQGCAAEILLVSGRYTVDAKSILGIFSLDLSNPVNLICEDENDYPKFKEWFASAGGNK